MAKLLEVTDEAYAALLDHVADQWTHLSVFRDIDAPDPQDKELMRLAATGPNKDPRLTRRVENGALHFELHLTGRDKDIQASDTKVVPVNGSGIFRGPAPDTTAMSLDQFDRFQFRNPADELSIHHRVHIPGGQSMVDFKQWPWKLGPNELYTRVDVPFPGVTSATHAAWANAFRFEGWFFGDQRPANRQAMVQASAVIDRGSPGVVQVIITRTQADGRPLDNNMGVFVMEIPKG